MPDPIPLPPRVDETAADVGSLVRLGHVDPPPVPAPADEPDPPPSDDPPSDDPPPAA
ncbi:hypothetical protein ACF061_00540 [Streptomyces sp. NPDC015220]|uniref:hypothetical protein n=1 Tax=Streptomyces sp. NPDC015220 TaxID=3364947 RepID=UPI00370146EC